MIAGSYLAGTNTRRVGRALAALFRGSVSKDTVSRVWRKIKGDWEAWNARDLSSEAMVRLILDGTVVRVRIDRKATAISLLVVLGIRADGQKVLLSVRNMGGESEAAWRAVLDDLDKRGLKRPELAIVDGAPGLEKALGSLWSDLLIQRCTVHKLRNLIAHAPKRLAEEVASDFSDMVYAGSAKEVATRRKAFIRKWRLKCRAVADSLEEAGEQLFTFTEVATVAMEERAHDERNRAAYMKSSSGASRRRRCCPPERRPPCYFGRCSPPGRSDYGRLTAGAPSVDSSLEPLDLAA